MPIYYIVMLNTFPNDQQISTQDKDKWGALANMNFMEFVDYLKNYSVSLPRWTLLKGVSVRV
jgi:hypothetical protein